MADPQVDYPIVQLAGYRVPVPVQPGLVHKFSRAGFVPPRQAKELDIPREVRVRRAAARRGYGY